MIKAIAMNNGMIILFLFISNHSPYFGCDGTTFSQPFGQFFT